MSATCPNNKSGVGADFLCNCKPLEKDKDQISKETKEDVDRIMVHKEPNYIMGLDKLLIFDKDTLIDMHPKDLLKQIDSCLKIVSKFTKLHKRIALHKWKEMWLDVEVEFGSWSNLFNKVLREKLKETSQRMTKEETPANKVKTLNLHNQYSWVNAYWWNRFHFVNKILRSKSGLGGISIKKGLEQGRKTLKDLINEKVDPSRLHPKFKEVIENLKKASVDKDVKDTLDNM